MKKTRKWISLAVAMLLVFSLAACDTQPAESQPEGAESSETDGSTDTTVSAEDVATTTDTLAESADSTSATVGTGSTGTTKKPTTGTSKKQTTVTNTTTTEKRVTDVKKYIRNEKGLSISDYQKQMASFKLSDPLNAKTYTESEKEAQRKAASKMRTRLNVAIAKEATTFKVEPGVYRFVGQIPFEIAGVQNMYIDISDCTFILEGAQQFILGRSCRNVVFQGPATIDREGSLATQFTIQEYNEGSQTITAKLLDGYKICDKAFGGGTFQWFNEDGSMIQMSFISFSKASYVDEAKGIVKFEGVVCDKNFSNDNVLKAGQLGSVAITGGMALNVGLYSCENMYLLDITNYGAGMMMHAMDSNGDLLLKRVYNVRMPGTNRLVAGSAGQLEFTVGTPTIEDCIFGFCEDDSIDIMGHVGFLYKQESDNTVIIKGTATATPVKAGDTLEIFDGVDYTRTYSVKAVKVEEITDSEFNELVRAVMIKNHMRAPTPGWALRTMWIWRSGSVSAIAPTTSCPSRTGRTTSPTTSATRETSI